MAFYASCKICGWVVKKLLTKCCFCDIITSIRHKNSILCHFQRLRPYSPRRFLSCKSALSFLSSILTALCSGSIIGSMSIAMITSARSSPIPSGLSSRISLRFLLSFFITMSSVLVSFVIFLQKLPSTLLVSLAIMSRRATIYEFCFVFCLVIALGFAVLDLVLFFGWGRKK